MGNVSNFFNEDDVLTNDLNVKQSMNDFRYLKNNAQISASRLDLIKFILNRNLEIVRWFTNEEVSDKLKLYKFSAHRTGLGVLFRVDKSETEKMFYKLVDKVLGKEHVKLSVNELIYYKDINAIMVSFKSMTKFEGQKIGVLSTKHGFSNLRWIQK